MQAVNGQIHVLERARIAREMHDVLAHRLSLRATYAGALEYRPDAAPEQLARPSASCESASTRPWRSFGT